MKLFHRISIFFLLLTSLLFSVCAGQHKAGAGFFHLTTKNGLSSNAVRSVLQDSKGFYWITTQDGLNRFDGSGCKIFRNQKDDSTSLSMNYCNFLLEDKYGDIWVASNMGVNRYIYKEAKFERFYLKHPTLGFDLVNRISGMVKDAEGNIWISSRGLWCYNVTTHKWKIFIHDSANNLSIPEGLVNHLQFDRVNNYLWMKVDGNFVFFDIKKNKFYHENYNPSGNLLLKIKSNYIPFGLDSANRIWFCNNEAQLFSFQINTNTLQKKFNMYKKKFFKLNVDRNNKIWFHYWNGSTIIFDPQLQQEDSLFLSAYHAHSALSNQANDIYIDKHNIHWISSNEGVSIYNPLEQSVRYFNLGGNRKTVEGTPNSIHCMLEGDGDNIWLGTNTGLCKYNLNNNSTTFFDELPFSKTIVKCLFLQNFETLWIGTMNSLYTYHIKTGKLLKQVPFDLHTQFITADKFKNIWVGSWTQGLLQFSPDGKLQQFLTAELHSSTSILYDRLISFSFDKDSTHMWIGYNGGHGFGYMNINTMKFEQFKIQTGERYFNAINTITAIDEDKHGNLWIGCHGGGLVYFNRSSNFFKTYTQSDGLQSNYVNAILKDPFGNRWIATSNGLNIINPRNGDIIHTAIDVAMKINDYLPSGSLRKNGKMLFFSGNKLVEVDPINFQENTYPSQLLINSFKIFNKEYTLPEKDSSYFTSLSHDQNSFSFNFSLLKPDPNSSIKYYYRLEGFDIDWINAGEIHSANYTNIPPGAFKFQVKALNAAGKSFLSKPVLVSIAPPYWKTWWFILLTCLLLFIIIFSLIRYRFKQLKKMYSLRSVISQDLHDEVASTLSGIRLYSELAKDQLQQQKVAKVQESLEVIASNAAEMAENMSDIVWTINPKNDSFTKLLNKLKGFASVLSAAKNIQLQFDQQTPISDELLTMEQRRNLYLVCKEAIHNAIQYADAKILTIRVFIRHHQLYITIKDDGKGFDTLKKYEGNGMVNMKTRCREINGNFEIHSSKENGTTINISCRLGK